MKGCLLLHLHVNFFYLLLSYFFTLPIQFRFFSRFFLYKITFYCLCIRFSPLHIPWNCLFFDAFVVRFDEKKRKGKERAEVRWNLVYSNKRSLVTSGQAGVFVIPCQTREKSSARSASPLLLNVPEKLPENSLHPAAIDSQMLLSHRSVCQPARRSQDWDIYEGDPGGRSGTRVYWYRL